jgi:hypothetical protein
MDSKNHFLNRSVENNILNFSGNEFNINDDKEEQAPLQSTKHIWE